MNVLVAEDQPPAALFLRRLLERLGHDVTVAANGEVAWQLVCEKRFPVVISDWMMPGLDGLEFCRKIRELNDQPYTYFILLTSRQSHQDRLAGLRAGADDFLVKPPDVEELAVRLEIARRILAVQEELERRNFQLSELALVDELTGVKNLRSFRIALEMHQGMASRQGVPLSLMILDVDDFKGYNDAFGHPAGDEALRSFAHSLVENVRKNDVVARIGGEEFAIILPDADQSVSTEMAERIRSMISNRPWPLRTITASLGVATTSASTHEETTLIEQADQALYRSKRNGRNAVSHFQDDKETQQSLMGPAASNPDPPRSIGSKSME